MTDHTLPVCLREVERLMSQGKIEHASFGLSRNTPREYYATISVRGQNSVNRRSHSLSHALLDAMNVIHDAPAPVAPTLSLPGMVTRPSLPGMTR